MFESCASSILSAFLFASPHNSRSMLVFNQFATGNDATAGERTSGRVIQRDFCFVPYGASFPIVDSAFFNDINHHHHRDRPSISCDGRITRSSDNNGLHLELSHWTNHQTPKELYADTSTEIALNFVKLRQRLQQEQEKNSKTAKQFEYYADFDNAWVLNNHYDTDGVLSVWACLEQEPDALDRYAHLLIQGAEAGDFGEWSSDNGVKLDCALSAFLKEFSDEDEEMAYHAALKQLPDMLNDFELTGGQSYEHLWRNGGWEQALSGWHDIQEGRVKLERYEDSRLVLVYEKQQEDSQQSALPILLSPYALHRGLCEAGLWSDTTRILRVMQQPMSTHDSKDKKQYYYYSYQYEKIGHGWVQDVVKRHHVPDIDKEDLIQKLQERFCSEDEPFIWMVGGSSGLVSICQSRKGCPPTFLPSQVARALVELDPGAAK